MPLVLAIKPATYFFARVTAYSVGEFKIPTWSTPPPKLNVGAEVLRTDTLDFNFGLGGLAQRTSALSLGRGGCRQLGILNSIYGTQGTFASSESKAEIHTSGARSGGEAMGHRCNIA